MRVLSMAESIDTTARNLGVSGASDVKPLLMPALRRAVHILAPASAADVIRFVADPLAFAGDVRSEVETALDDLIAYGDILEMRRQDSDDWGAPATLLRPAPPSFVHRTNGDIILLGGAGDHSSPLSQLLAAQVVENGAVRRLKWEKSLPETLRLLGLAEISEPAWLRTPKAEPAKAYLARWIERLRDEPAVTTPIEGLQIISEGADRAYYRGRWQLPGRQTGAFVGRRPQLYGAPLWTLVGLEEGRVCHLLDLYATDDKQRACDLAWRIQCALDSEGGSPQFSRVRRGRPNSAIHVFAPLPSFAERRLALVGVKVAGTDCLYSYELPSEYLEKELQELRAALWLSVREEPR